MAKSATASSPTLEVGLVCDAGTSYAGIHGLTDLFRYAGGFAARRTDPRADRAMRVGAGGRADGAPRGANDESSSPVRITHWRADDDGDGVRCVHDTHPGRPHALALLVVPGNEQAPLGTVGPGPLDAWLRAHHGRGVVLAAVCGGVFVLARTGLLDGRQATTHWAFHETFAARFPEVLTETDHMVIDYGDVMTGGGVLAWADVGLRLVERFLGPAVMRETARFMLVDPPGREQRFYCDFEPPMKHGDRAILKVQQWLATQREESITVADLARRACLEPRTFLRRFVQATRMTPSEYRRRLRVARARELLEFSRTSVDRIAATVGYRDVGGFRRVFRTVVGLTPSAYRRRFGTRA